MVQLFNLAQGRNHKDGLKLYIKIQQLHCLLEYDPGYVSPCKEALSMLGFLEGRLENPCQSYAQRKEMPSKVLLGRSISSGLKQLHCGVLYEKRIEKADNHGRGRS